MAKPSKLNIIWASTGAVVDPGDSKFQLGWEAEIPPYQWFNYILNKHSEMLDHVNTYGIANYDSETEYQFGSRVLYNGVQYKCTKTTSTGSTPSDKIDWTLNEGIDTLPIGTVMLFDANTPTTIDGVTVNSGVAGSWVDNSTLRGWYACVSGNQDKGCPNLVDKFIMGKTITGAGANGGSNTHTITLAQMPQHSHSADHSHDASSANDTHNHSASSSGGSHSHTASSANDTHTHSTTVGNQSADHTHSVTGGSHRHLQTGPLCPVTPEQYYADDYTEILDPPDYTESTTAGSATDGKWMPFTLEDGGHTHTVSDQSANHNHIVSLASDTHNHGITVNTSTSHSHTISVANDTHNHSITVAEEQVTTSSAGSGSSYDSRPAYYSIIYIRKCI